MSSNQQRKTENYRYEYDAKDPLNVVQGELGEMRKCSSLDPTLCEVSLYA